MTFEDIQLSVFTLTEKEVAKGSKTITAAYKSAAREIEKKMGDLWLTLDGIDPNRRYAVAVQYNRLQKLIDAIQAEYMAVAKSTGAELERLSKLSVNEAYYRKLFLDEMAPGAPSLFIQLSPAVIDTSVYGTGKVWNELRKEARDRIEKTFGDINAYFPQSGTLLNELVTKNRPSVLAGLESDIRQGIIQGKSFRKTADAVRETLGTDLNKALRIASTESHRNMMAGAYASTQAARAQGVEIRRRVEAVLDMKTREQSATVDGRLEDDNGYFTYPGGVKVRFPGNSGVPRWDINDREQVIDLVPGLEPEARRARNPVTGKNEVISWTAFSDWQESVGLVRNKSGILVLKK
jgi:hypothetical protein